MHLCKESTFDLNAWKRGGALGGLGHIQCSAPAQGLMETESPPPAVEMVAVSFQVLGHEAVQSQRCLALSPPPSPDP